MSTSQMILAALSGAPTQNERLLVLHTTLGQDVLLAERAEIFEAIGAGAGDEGAGDPLTGFRIVVDALAADTHIELKQLIGQPALLELLTSASRTVLRPFHGQITRASLLGSDGGLARYRLTIEPWLSFLGHRNDAWVFQQRTVIEIVEEVFADYQGQGKLLPAWRWELEDVAVYPQRSMSIQYHESDLQFVHRLLREEGLFFWFEHTGQSGDASLGAHTLVIADHNNAFKPGPQPLVRFTQPGAVQPEDSLTRWRESGATHAATLDLASLDHRSLGLRPQNQSADPATLGAASAVPHPELGLTDIPGAYAYENSAQGARLALRQMQAIDALREQAQARGTLRSSAPGTTFTLTDHSAHDGLDDKRDRFVMLGVRHTARNNLSADQRAQLEGLGAAIDRINARIQAGHTTHHSFGQAPARNAGDANAGDDALYECSITAQRAAVPVRLGALDARGLPDPRLHARPSVQGVQTAIVVGTSGQPIHTDRDQRIKVQFHWQRGASASHRIDHTAGDNAPASDASGTWVRVSQAVAGANWGTVFTPRLGQEVLVQFINGDIDRPVVIGAAYNGQGSPDAQGNQNAAGAATATGNAQAWFPGTRKIGELQAHAHPAVLAGHKSQELASSQGGTGGYNQLVFDDTSGAGRIELASTSAQTRLQLGHLLHQNDNQRLQPRGHGLDLSTAAWGAVRAGSGVLLSAHGKTGSQSATRSLDSREPQTQLEQSQQLLHTLAESAQQHKAKGTDEPDVIGAKKEYKAKQLTNEQGLYAGIDSLGASDSRAQHAQGEGGIGGGTGDGVTAWHRPDLVIAAPGGIGAFTPATSIVAAGHTMTLVAGQDMQLAIQGSYATSIKNGLTLFTYGRATDASKPNQETGIKLHAASGNVRLEAQSEAVKITADKAVKVASTNGMVKITAPNHILLTAAGAALDIQSGSITLKGPGMIEFRAGIKNLTGPGSASAPAISFPIHQELHLRPTGPLSVRFAALGADELAIQSGWEGLPYRIVKPDGDVLASGTVASDGRIPRVTVDADERLVLEVGHPERATFDPLPAPSPAATDDADEEDIEEDQASDVNSRYRTAINGGQDTTQYGPFLSESAVADLLR